MTTPRALSLVTAYQLACAALAAVLTFWLWRPATVAVLVGGGFGTLNFWGLRLLAERALMGEGKHKLLWGLLLAMKLALALALLAALLVVLRLPPLGFALGLSTMIVGMMLAMAHVIVIPKAPTA